MGGVVLVLWLFLFVASSTVEPSLGMSHETHLLRPHVGSSAGHHVPGVSCLSWRLAVETHNIIDWDLVPQACESYVGHYMLGGQYREDSALVVSVAIAYAESLKLAGDGKDIWVFDIDQTSLNLMAYYARPENGFGAKAFNKTTYDAWVNQGKAPALPETHKLYEKLMSLGIKIVFITGKSETQRRSTVKNMRKAGYHTWEKLILKGSYATGSTSLIYKSNARRKLEASGYRIVGNIGDQWSDILGTNVGKRTFKLPNPMFYIS